MTRGLSVILKSHPLGKTNMEYIGFWVTRNGTQPINNKVESIVNMAPPKNTKHVRTFIGLVNFYRDMRARQSHLIHPLAALTSNIMKFKWNDVEQKMSDDIKIVITHGTLLAYTDFNKSLISIRMLSINRY